jgi:uncharacterized protein
MDKTILPRWMLSALGVLLMLLLITNIISDLRSFQSPPQIMRVSADGKVTANPDLAIIRMGVASEGIDLISVKNQNNIKINQLLAYLKQQKIDAQAIQTTEFYASPKYNYSDGKNTMAGYQATQMVTVKILAEAIQNGANVIQGVDFSLLDNNKFKLAAMKEAISHAEEKAKAIAANSHLKLGRIINVAETNEFANVMPSAMVSFKAASPRAVEPQIEPGMQEISANISLLFEVY